MDENNSYFSWTCKKKNENVTIENKLADYLNKSPSRKINALIYTTILKKVFIKYNNLLLTVKCAY